MTTMTTLYPVTFNAGCTNGHIVFIAFDAAAAAEFAAEENDAAQCEILTTDEVALVDNFGFPCARREAGFIAPWLRQVSDFCHRHYAPESWARYCAMMSRDG
jgi:hypothetical protein